MSLDTAGIFSAVTSHAAGLGKFDRVNRHEPKSAPGSGVSAHIIVNRLDPAQRRSGLSSTTVRLELLVVIYQNMLKEPQDSIDPSVLSAVDALMAAYSGDFALGGKAANVDLLGAHGAPLSAQAGYVDIDKFKYRAMTVTLPLIINDLWEQVS